MAKITLTLEPGVLLFYRQVARASGRSVEQVLADALFRLAGELSLNALRPDG